MSSEGLYYPVFSDISTAYPGVEETIRELIRQMDHG